MGIPIRSAVPDPADPSQEKALAYMGLTPGKPLLGQKIDSDAADERVAGMVAVAASGIQRPELVDRLTHYVRDADELEAANAALSLGNLLGRHALLPLFETLVAHPSTLVRTIAGQVLVNQLGA